MADKGTADQAIEWVIGVGYDDGHNATVSFLTNWKVGTLDNYPEYLIWLRKQTPTN
jgi:hypothetical protein